MGGMERAAVNTANGLNDSKIEIVFISLFKKEHFFSLDKDIKLVEPDGFNANSLSFFKTIRWIRTIVKIEKPNKVLAFNKLYAALTAFAMIGLNIPFYISERSSPLFAWKQPLKTINRLAFWLKPPTGVIAQTSIAASYQKKYFKKSKIKVIPNILRPITLYPEIERKNTILAVGRLGDHLKGFDLLIESFSFLKNKTWQLQIAGGDENGQEIKELATKLGIINRIKFLGKVKEIDKVYAYAGIFVIPSRSEGFPNALAEAMAAGCPCIAFDFIAGPRDMITSRQNGVIVENKNVKALAKEIDLLIDNPICRKELGTTAKKISNTLNKDKIAKEILRFLNLQT
jgi:glycosyltransferase involved in cell wall biosynthesis